jgi:hypothetical protein
MISAHIFQQLKVNLAIGESLQLGFAQRHTDKLADLLAQCAIGRSAKNLEALIFTQLRRALPLRGRPCSILRLLARRNRRTRGWFWCRLRVLFRLLSLP